MSIPSASGVEVHPVGGYIGAEIRGVDLQKPLSEGAVSDIRQALLRHKVIFFRAQHIDHAQQVA
jgi:alpha-ketoglutarate-dependent sulfate ester dioxygenase